jgi:flagellar basal-body rod protein FlgB
MDLFDTTQLALTRAAQGVQLRQQTIAENLANANSPGYRRRDVQFQEAIGDALAQGRGPLEALSFSPDVDQTAPLRGDGSNVDIDREQSTMARVALEQDALTQVMRARTAILRNVIGQH